MIIYHLNMYNKKTKHFEKLLLQVNFFFFIKYTELKINLKLEHLNTTYIILQ